MGRFHVATDKSQGPYVISLDVGSSGTRGGIYDGRGRPLEEHRIKLDHAFQSAPDGTNVIDADLVVLELTTIIGRLLAGFRHPIGGIAIDTFASSLVGVDADLRAVTPCYTYADNRCSADVRTLRTEVDEAAHQQRTGTRFHTSYLVPRFRWLARTAPAAMAAASRWVSLGEYFHLRTIGMARAGTSTAAWTGMLDRRTGDWDHESLALAGIDRAVLSAIAPPSMARTAESPWPQLADARWFPPITDGFASNLGAGGDNAATLVASMSTSGAMRVLVDDVPADIPAGLWCCRVDETRSLLGGALNDVGRAVTWLQSTLRLPDETSLLAVLDAPPDPLTPTVIPFFTGERSTGYAGAARALFAGVSVAATPAHLYRGTLEGVALSFERVGDQLREVATSVTQVVGAGRVMLDVPPLAQLLADVLDRPVLPLTQKRTTLRGTALHALDIIAPGGRRAPTPFGTVRAPIPDHVGYYDRRAADFDRLYPSTLPVDS
jgi:gluconokinase